jgi:hypothetical protein
MAKKPRSAPIPHIDPAAVEDKPLRFSFKHLDTANPKFNPSECSTEYFCKLLATLQCFSTWTVDQFIDQTNKEHRHIIDFGTTSEPDGFQNVPGLDRDQIGYVDGWQFSVYPDVPWSDWRAHGILIDDTFYIVWLDPEHRLFPKKLALGA